jgi:hypothetical protein
VAAGCSSSSSRVYSSTTLNHLSDPPETVRSWTKSHVQTSFGRVAGRARQLFAAVPGCGDVPFVLRRFRVRRPNDRQSRRTRLTFTAQPSRTNNARSRR